MLPYPSASSLLAHAPAFTSLHLNVSMLLACRNMFGVTMLIDSCKVFLGYFIIFDIAGFICKTGRDGEQEENAHQLSGAPEPPSACQSKRKGA